MPTISYKTFLMFKETSESSYAKLLDIKDYPDIFGEPDTVQTTTLSNRTHTYALGVQDSGTLSFTANYELADFIKVKNMEGKRYDFAIWFGGTETASGLSPTGSEGKFEFTGELTAGVSGAGVNDVREMVVYIAPSSDIRQTATPDGGD